ncbi:MAG: LolA-like putative outer membrane lipoprotein chaperone [Bacteroidaceae bacterium]
MKKIFFLIVLMLTTTSAIWAQKDIQARKILDKAANIFNASKGIEIDFNMQGKHEMRGILKVRNSMFQLSSNGTTTWYDGRTQWTYQKASNEVSISTPTAAQLSKINPESWLYCYKKGFNYTYNGTKGKAHTITLTPEEKDQGVKSIVLVINESSYTPKSVTLTTTSGSSTTIFIKSYKMQQGYNKATFTYPKNQYPTAEVIDLR